MLSGRSFSFSAMSRAVLVDLLHRCCASCTGASLLGDSVSDLQVFVLCGNTYREKNGFVDTFLSSCKSVHILDSSSTVESLYRFKQTLDQLDLSSITVLTTAQGKEVLAHYQNLLFTALYDFQYKQRPVDETCPSCRASTDSVSPGEEVSEEVSTFMQQLPALKGDLTVLKSGLIPGRLKQNIHISFMELLNYCINEWSLDFSSYIKGVKHKSRGPESVVQRLQFGSLNSF